MRLMTFYNIHLMLTPFFPALVMSTDLLSFEHPSVLLFCLRTLNVRCTFCCVVVDLKLNIVKTDLWRCWLERPTSKKEVVESNTTVGKSFHSVILAFHLKAHTNEINRNIHLASTLFYLGIMMVQLSFNMRPPLLYQNDKLQTLIIELFNLYLIYFFTKDNIRGYCDSILLARQEAEAEGKQEEAEMLSSPYVIQIMSDIFFGMYNYLYIQIF